MSICENPNRHQNYRIWPPKRVLQLPLSFCPNSMRKRGLEPLRGNPHYHLKVARIPFRHFRRNNWRRGTLFSNKTTSDVGGATEAPIEAQTIFPKRRALPRPKRAKKETWRRPTLPHSCVQYHRR
jgi:hypothetical protein